MDRSELEKLLRSMDDRDCLLRSHEIAANFRNARDWFDREGLKVEADKAQWELEAWSLVPSTARAGVRRTDYLPQFRYEDGSSWPELKNVSDEQWEYLRGRADESANLAFRARYNDLLWMYKRDYQRGVSAIAAYVEAETILWEWHEKKPDCILGPAWIVSLYRPIELAKQLSRQSEYLDARARVIGLIRHVSESGEVAVSGSTESLFTKAIDFVDVFDEKDRHSIGEALDRLLENLSDSDWFKESFLKIRLHLSRKMAVSSAVERATRHLAEFHLRKADEAESESKLLAASQLAAAVSYVELLPPSEHGKAQLELIQRRRTTLLSDDSQYATFTHEIAIDPSHVNEYLDRYRKTEAPLVFALPAFLISNMPSKEGVHRLLESHKQAAPFLYAINHTPIWDDGVVEFIAETDEQLARYHFWATAMEALQFVSLHLPQLERALDNAWSEEELIETLTNAQLIDPERVPYIEDGVSAYFNGAYRAAVRLLALEMEPIARGVLAKLGFAVTRSNPENGAGAQRVKDLSECLQTPELSEVLHGSWVIAARALLVHDGGQKLRHRVAHGRNIENVANKETALVLVGLILWVANFYSTEEVNN